MLKFVAATLFATLACAPGLAAAQTATHDHSSMAQASPTAAGPAKPALADGEVRKVDRAKGTIVLKHGPLESINMPAMTMEFVAKPPTLLDKVKPGDRVRFTPEQGKDGALIVSTLEVVKG